MDLGWGEGGWRGSRTVPVLSPPRLCFFDLALANDTAGKRQGAHSIGQGGKLADFFPNHRLVCWQPIPLKKIFLLFFRSEHDWTVHKYSLSSLFWAVAHSWVAKNLLSSTSQHHSFKKYPSTKKFNTRKYIIPWQEGGEIVKKEGPRLSKHMQKFNEGSTERPDHLWSDTKSHDEMKLTSVGDNQAVRMIFFSIQTQNTMILFLNFPKSLKACWIFFCVRFIFFHFGFYWVELNLFVPCNFQFSGLDIFIPFVIFLKFSFLAYRIKK